MTIAFLAHVEGISSNGGVSATTSSINTSGANFIVAAVVSLSSTLIGNVTDSFGNTYTALTIHGGTSPAVRLLYCENPIVGAGHTFTTAPTGSNFPSICVAAFSGVGTSSLDAQSGAAGGTPGAITPAVNNELIITNCGLTSATAPTINGGFTITGTATFTGGQSYGCSMAYLIQTTAASANPTWATGNVMNSGMASFKPGAAITVYNDPLWFGMEF